MHKSELEIVIITYNRYTFLDKTLQQLLLSPFAGCRITVLDNCSTDATRDTCVRLSSSFPDFRVITHRVNIGGNANYLRAVEFSTSTYTWVLCDDDFLDFSHCDDVIDAINSGEFDLVEVGATERGGWSRGVATSARKMVDQGLDYHFRLSFFPAYIFRTSLFDSACFCWGYKHIDRLYPQFAFLNKSVREDFSIYLAKTRIVIRNDVNDNSFSPLAWYAAWVTCCRTIPDQLARSRAIEHATSDRGFFKCITFWTILDKKMGDGEFWIRVAGIFLALNLRQRMKYLMVFPLALIPVPLPFWVWVRSTIYRIMNVPDTEVPPVRVVHRE